MGKIALVGLGAMGLPMAKHLGAWGYEVTGIDASAEARASLVDAVSPAMVDLTSVSTIVTMLPEGAHVREAYDKLILPNAAPGTVLIDCSTIDAETAKSLNQAATEKGFQQIDAPVSGGPEAAGSGKLSFMVGGSDAAFAAAKPVLECLGQKITHFGAPGAGQAAKACHNMICGITAMAVLEGFALAEASGLDPAQFYTLCAGAAAQSWTLENRCPVPGVAEATPASNAYAPGFAARLMAKDLRLAQMAAAANGQATPFGALAAKSFTAFTEKTGGLLDFSSYYTELRGNALDAKDS